MAAAESVKTSKYSQFDGPIPCHLGNIGQYPLSEAQLPLLHAYGQSTKLFTFVGNSRLCRYIAQAKESYLLAT
jgi:hypothetical protein